MWLLTLIISLLLHRNSKLEGKKNRSCVFWHTLFEKVELAEGGNNWLFPFSGVFTKDRSLAEAEAVSCPCGASGQTDDGVSYNSSDCFSCFRLSDLATPAHPVWQKTIKREENMSGNPSDEGVKGRR